MGIVSFDDWKKQNNVNSSNNKTTKQNGTSSGYKGVISFQDWKNQESPTFRSEYSKTSRSTYNASSAPSRMLYGLVDSYTTMAPKAFQSGNYDRAKWNDQYNKLIKYLDDYGDSMNHTEVAQMRAKLNATYNQLNPNINLPSAQDLHSQGVKSTVKLSEVQKPFQSDQFSTILNQKPQRETSVRNVLAAISQNQPMTDLSDQDLKFLQSYAKNNDAKQRKISEIGARNIAESSKTADEILAEADALEIKMRSEGYPEGEITRARNKYISGSSDKQFSLFPQTSSSLMSDSSYKIQQELKNREEDRQWNQYVDYSPNSLYIKNRKYDPEYGTSSVPEIGYEVSTRTVGNYDSEDYGKLFYESVNGNQEASDFLHKIRDKYASNDFIDYDQAYEQYMSKDEVGLFNYLYKTEGYGKAREYYNYLLDKSNNSLKARAEAAEEEYIDSLDPVTKVALTGVSTVLKPGYDIANLGETLYDAATGKKINPYSGSGWVDYIRQSLKNDIVGSGDSFLSKAGGVMYDALFSTIDNMYGVALGGGITDALGLTGKAAIKMSEAIPLALMSTSAAQNSVMQNLKSGMPQDRAVITGLASGLVEYLTEKMPIENLVEATWQGKSGFASLIKQGLSEGGEEIAGDVMDNAVDILYDALTGTNYSDFRQQMNSYIIQNGLAPNDQNEAFKAVLWQKVQDAGLAGLEGAISGLMMGGTMLTAGQIDANRDLKVLAQDYGITKDKVDQSTVKELIDEGKSYDPKSKTYKKASQLQTMLDKGSVVPSRKAIQLLGALADASNTRELIPNTIDLLRYPDVDVASPTEHAWSWNPDAGAFAVNRPQTDSGSYNQLANPQGQTISTEWTQGNGSLTINPGLQSHNQAVNSAANVVQITQDKAFVNQAIEEAIQNGVAPTKAKQMITAFVDYDNLLTDELYNAVSTDTIDELIAIGDRGTLKTGTQTAFVPEDFGNNTAQPQTAFIPYDIRTNAQNQNQGRTQPQQTAFVPEAIETNTRARTQQTAIVPGKYDSVEKSESQIYSDIEAIQDIAEGYYKAGAEQAGDVLYANYLDDMDVDLYMHGMNAIYEQAVNGVPLQEIEVPEQSRPFIGDTVKAAMYAAAEGGNNATEQRNVFIPDGSKWNDSQNTGITGEGMAEGTGRTESTGSNTADNAGYQRTNAFNLTGETATAQSLGLIGGNSQNTVDIAELADTPDNRTLKALARSKGLTVVAFAGNNLSIDNSPYGVRGAIKGNTVYVRADHQQFTPGQIGRHEIFHNELRTDTNEKINRVFKALRSTFGSDSVDNVLLPAYRDLYRHANMGDLQIKEEILCDIYGGMNVFEDALKDLPEIAAYFGRLMDEGGRIAQAAVNEVNETAEAVEEVKNNGPPVAKYSSDSQESESIKKQLKSAEQLLSSMRTVTTVNRSDLPSTRNKGELADAGAKYISSHGGNNIDVPNFGAVKVDKQALKDGLKYLNTDDEYAAILAIPRVLKNGEIIDQHPDHKKNAGVFSTTFAAPILCNGKRMNMAVVVQSSGSGKSRYHVHRVLLPGGNVLEFSDNAKTEATTMPRSDSKMNRTGSITSAFNDNVPQPSETGNQNFSEEAKRQGSIENKLINYINEVIANPGAYHRPIVVIDHITGRLANDISAIVGFDVDGWKVSFAHDEVTHSNNRHGSNGKADHSMSDISEYRHVSNMENTYTEVKPGKRTSKKYRNSDNTPAKQVEIAIAKGNGTYYIIEAVPETSAKTIHIISVYQTKEAVSQEPRAKIDLGQNVQNELTSTASEDNVPQNPSSGNQKFSEEVKRQGSIAGKTLEDAAADLKERVNDLSAENARLLKRVDYYRGQTQLSALTEKSVAWKDVKSVITETSARKMAKNLVDSIGSTIDPSDIISDLQYWGTYLATKRGGKNTFEDVNRGILPIAKKLLENAQMIIDSDGSEILKDIRTTKIRISPQVKNDIADYNEWRKGHFGKMTVSLNSGTDITEFYNDMADKWGESVFPESNNTATDQLLFLADFVDNYQPITQNPYNYDMASAVQNTAFQIYDELLNADIMNPTFADKSKIKMQKLKEENRQKLEDIRRAAKDSKERQIQKLKDHYREVEAKKRSAREIRTAQQQLLRLARRLDRMKTTTANKSLINELIGDLDKAAVNITAGKVRSLQELNAWYESEKANNPDFVARHDLIGAQLARLGQKHISEMSLDDIRELTKALQVLETTIRTENQLIDAKDKADTFTQAMKVEQDIAASMGTRKGTLRDVDRIMIQNALSPTRFTHRLTGYNDSDPLYRTVAGDDGLVGGQRKMLDYQRQAHELFKTWLSDKTFLKDLTGKKADILKYDIVTADGKQMTIEMTKAMRMTLYLASMDSGWMEHMCGTDTQNEHIAGGGITLPDMGAYRKGRMKDAYSGGTIKAKLTKSFLSQLADDMSPKEKAFANAIHDYFGGMSKDAINSTSEKLLGISIAEVDDYLPISVDKNFLGADYGAIKFDGTLEGMGNLKERQRSKKPVVVRDITDILFQSIESTSRYYGLAIPIRNFNKLMGVTIGSVDAKGNYQNFEGSVLETIANKWGDGAKTYIENMISDLQFPNKNADDIDKMFSKLRSKYAGAVLTLNLSVALKQAASYPTAAAVLGWFPLIQAMKDFGHVDLDLIAKYTPLQWYRTDGSGVPELAELNKFQLPNGLNWIRDVDLLTTRKLWKASEYYVRNNQPGLYKKGAGIKGQSDAYYRAVADIYNQVIEETQPNYTPMQRPAYLKSKSEMTKTLMMFKTQPMQNYNILYDAIGDFRAKRAAYKNNSTDAAARTEYKESGKRLRNATTSQLGSLITFASMTMLWNLFRRKKEKYTDEEGNFSYETMLKNIGKDSLSSLFGMVPFGSEAYSMLSSMAFGDTYYGFESVTDSALGDLGNAIKTAWDAIGDVIESDESFDITAYKKKIRTVSFAVSKVLGIPAENIYNICTAIYKRGRDLTENPYMADYYALAWDLDPSANKSEFTKLLYRVYKAEDTDAYDTIRQMMIDSGEYATDTALAKFMEKNPDVSREDAIAAVCADYIDDKLTEYQKNETANHMTFENQAKYDQIAANLQKSSTVQNKSEEDQAALYQLAEDYINKDSAAWNRGKEAVESGIMTDVEYLLFRLALDKEDQANTKGTVGSYAKDEQLAAIKDMHWTDKQAKKYWDYLPSTAKNPYK